MGMRWNNQETPLKLSLFYQKKKVIWCGAESKYVQLKAFRETQVPIQWQQQKRHCHDHIIYIIIQLKEHLIFELSYDTIMRFEISYHICSYIYIIYNIYVQLCMYQNNPRSKIQNPKSKLQNLNPKIRNPEADVQHHLQKMNSPYKIC